MLSPIVQVFQEEDGEVIAAVGGKRRRSKSGSTRPLISQNAKDRHSKIHQTILENLKTKQSLANKYRRCRSRKWLGKSKETRIARAQWWRAWAHRVLS